MKRMVVTALTCAALVSSVCAQELKSIALPKPVTEGGKPLMQCLKERQSSREFDTQALTPQVLSNMLWAAWGINRPDTDHRTAPSARNWQEVDVYVTLPEAAYLYDAKANELKPVATGDHRVETGTQDFPATAPLNLVYVADLAKTGGGGSAGDQSMYSGADAAFIAQNVYLFCASEGLATVVRGSVDRETLSKTLGLRADQKIVLAQTVGYAKK